MRKLFLTLGMFFGTLTFIGMPAQAAESVTVKKVIEVPGASQEQVFEKARTWSETYGSISSVDPKAGVIVTNGEITYPSPPVDRVQYTILFKVKNSVEKNKSTVTFEDVKLQAPKSYITESVEETKPYTGGEITEVKSGKDIAAANKALNYVADNLGDYLLGKTQTASPLAKCPVCPTLATSPEEMKEHMKTHEHGTKQ